jgi:hypothetical protein
MRFRFNAAAAAVLAFSFVACYGQTSETTPQVKKQTAQKKAKAPVAPTVAEQIQALRRALDNQASQIDSLKAGMAEKDAQLQKAQQAAAEAQAAAARAEAAATSQQQAVGDNSTAVTTLQSAVTTLKAGQSTLAATVTDETAKLKKALTNPDSFHFKGATLTPYGFLAGESVFRTHATGGEMATPFSTIPYEHADAYSLSETYLSGRQSRAGLTIEGKVSWGTMRAILEGDFLGVGTTSNDNQSTSYLFRQRIALAEVETNSHWTFSGGQGWSLAAENRKGISTAAANIALPNQIDPNYIPGLVWTRGGGYRLTKSFAKASFAVAAENPQILYTASMAGNTPYAVMGSAGVNGGLLNAAISSCSPSTTIVNYTNQAEIDSAGNKVDSYVPVYKTVNSCANLANISFNQAPDMLVKAAFDPGFGHYEIFGIARFAHETVYPGETTNSNLYGGYKEITTGALVAPALPSSTSPPVTVSDSIVLGGLGASARVPVIKDKLTLGAKGLFGPGVGRYGDSTLSDLTANAAGKFEPIHNASGLLTVEATPTPRLLLYLYYGGDYAGREDFGSSATTSLAAPSALFCPTSATESGAFTCTATPTAANITAGGSWGGHWAAPTAAAVGYGSRLLNNASSTSNCNVTTNPTYNSSSTGYYAGAACGAQTRDTQEITGGYWYDLYKGDRGRLRQGFQYGYVVREAWSGAGGIGAKGVENMFYTSFRYYLP